jgi:uncharacterized protein (TIGR02118 family)
MHKLIAIYKQPENAADFNSYFEETHTAITKKIPHLKEIRVNKVFGTPQGKSNLHMIVELCFQDETSFSEAMKTKEAMESGKDLGNFAKDIVSVHFAKETTV